MLIVVCCVSFTSASAATVSNLVSNGTMIRVNHKSPHRKHPKKHHLKKHHLKMKHHLKKKHHHKKRMG